MSDQPREGDWVNQVLGHLESAISLVRDRAVAPVVAAVRWIVFGLLAAIIGLAALVLVAIILVRLLFLLPGHRAWLAHGITSLLFLILGVVAMRKRHPKAELS